MTIGGLKEFRHLKHLVKCLPHGKHSRKISSCYIIIIIIIINNNNKWPGSFYIDQTGDTSTSEDHPKKNHREFSPKVPATKFLKIKYSTSSVPISLVFIHVLLLEFCHSLALSAISICNLGGHIWYLRRRVTCHVIKWERTQKGNEEMLRRPRETKSRKEAGIHPQVSLTPSLMSSGKTQLYVRTPNLLPSKLNMAGKTHNHIVVL